jgi:tRNA (uracil-5-)-methyltransferase
MSITTINPSEYPQLLAAKVANISEQFTEMSMPTPEVFPSSSSHYRLRAEFRIWHEANSIYYAMFDPAEPKIPVKVDNFNIASENIYVLMRPLLESLSEQEILKNRLFQIEFLSTLSGDMLITLIYHRRLDDHWESAARELSSKHNIQIIGRSKKQKIVLDHDYVTEQLPVDGKQYAYKQYEGGFTQPNGEINAQMISWAKARCGNNPNSDLLELYCGNGNFTIPLAAHFRRVLANEVSKTSVKAALENFAMNDVANALVLRMSSEELTSALNKEREFRRLRGIDLEEYAIDTVLVDPPRAGLDASTRELISQFENIIYISCNPQTLLRDMQILTKTHHTSKFAMFDQFPYTHHMECGVYLTSRTEHDSKTDG